MIERAAMMVMVLALASGVLGQVKAVWVGQVEKDLAGPSANLVPSDTQDLHVRLEGLPAKEIAHIRIHLHGGGEWQFKGPWGPWGIAMEREGQAATAALYMEPQKTEESSAWHMIITYADGSTEELAVKAGASDTKLRMPDAVFSAEWMGQDGRDWTGRYAAVGPDGIQDVVLKLKGLSDKLGVLKAIRVEAEGGPVWEYGVNPEKVWNAEVFRESASARTAELLISPPEESIAGRPLKLTVWYGHNRDHMFTGSGVAGESDADLKTQLPETYDLKRMDSLAAEWIGQDGSDVTGAGDVRVRLTGLPTVGSIVAASLSDSRGGHWAWRADEQVTYYVPEGGEYVEPARAMALRAGEGNAADIFFPPFRDERDARMTLRVLLEDGSMHFGQFPGQACDVSLRGEKPNDRRIVARAGDDLRALVKEYGQITLSPGTYTVDGPLEIEQPVTITGPREAIVRFRQPEGSEKWNGAIYVGADNVTFEGFSIGFDGVVDWAVDDWAKGCAILRTHEREDRTGDLVNLVVREMEIRTSELPPLEDRSKPHGVPNIIRAGRILCGQITANTFLGGTIDVVHGPWVVSDNLHLGAPAGGMTWDAFAGHYLHDLTMEGNRLHADESAGKIWRFLVLTQYSSNAIVRGNDVRGVGMRDNDPMPNPNAPEIFLTEAYRLHYEGKPVHRSADGHVMQIPVLMWGAARPGSVVAILDGEHAGKWYRIAQPIDAITFLMDEPMPAGDYAISISTGMVDELYENNTIDGSGGSSSMMQLCATAFNTIVRNNRIIGGGGVLVQCVPTEHPGVWGWSHCPLFDFVFEGNVLDETRGGLTMETNHSLIHTKSVPGRLYATVSMRGNEVRWSDAVAQWRAAHVKPEQEAKRPLHAITLGSAEAPGNEDMVVTASGNRVVAPGSMQKAKSTLVRNATLNGEAMTERVVETQ